jgi:hypothetical protein
MGASIFVIPTQAGNQLSVEFWFPACAGMTRLEIGKLPRDYSSVLPLREATSDYCSLPRPRIGQTVSRMSLRKP